MSVNPSRSSCWKSWSHRPQLLFFSQSLNPKSLAYLVITNSKIHICPFISHQPHHQATIISCLEYCNNLLTRVLASTLASLQSLLNILVRAIFSVRPDQIPITSHLKVKKTKCLQWSSRPYGIWHASVTLPPTVFFLEDSSEHSHLLFTGCTRCTLHLGPSHSPSLSLSVSDSLQSYASLAYLLFLDATSQWGLLWPNLLNIPDGFAQFYF